MDTGTCRRAVTTSCELWRLNPTCGTLAADLSLGERLIGQHPKNGNDNEPLGRMSARADGVFCSSCFRSRGRPAASATVTAAATVTSDEYSERCGAKDRDCRAEDFDALLWYFGVGHPNEHGTGKRL